MLTNQLNRFKNIKYFGWGDRIAFGLTVLVALAAIILLIIIPFILHTTDGWTISNGIAYLSLAISLGSIVIAIDTALNVAKSESFKHFH